MVTLISFILHKVYKIYTISNMNISIDISTTKNVKPSKLSDWLLERGIPAITTQEAARILAVNESQVRVNLASSRRRGELVSPARGLWVPVPLENRSSGHPDPLSYIDAMMRKLDREYCIGWLSAAALHGAAHQAPQVFQVAVSAHLPARSVGSSRLEFFTRGYVDQIPTTLVSRSQGVARVPTPAATMLMLADDIANAGGLDNAVTTIVELAEEHPNAVADLGDCAAMFSLAAARRVGWILETFAEGVDIGPIARYCAASEGAFSLLSPHAGSRGAIARKWNLRLNREVDPDL